MDRCDRNEVVVDHSPDHAHWRRRRFDAHQIADLETTLDADRLE
jgi:hypothetical protein